MPDASKASMDAIQQMLQTGAEVQEQNVKAMKEVFDAFWSQSGQAAAQSPGEAATPPAPAVQRPAPKEVATPKRRPGAKE